LDDFLAKYNEDDEDDNGKKKKKKGKETRKKKKAVVELYMSDDDCEADVEPLEPAMVVDMTLDDDNDEIDLLDDVDEATKRRQKLLEEAREAREALIKAERESDAVAQTVEILDDDDDNDHQPVPQPAPKKNFGKKIKVTLCCDKEADPYMLGEKESFERIFQSFAQERGVDVKDCTFSFDGLPFNSSATPKELEVEEDDQIDVRAPPRTKPKSKSLDQDLFENEQDEEQARPAKKTKVSSKQTVEPTCAGKIKKKHDKVILIVKADSDRKAQKFRIHDDDAFEKALSHYVKKKSLHLSACSFMTKADHLSIDVTKTPAHYDLSGDIEILATLPEF